MKKVFSGILIALTLFITASPSYAADIQIKIDGVTIISDVNPESKGNRTMVPLRVISEDLGAIVKWSDSQVTLIKNDLKVILKLNSNEVVKNGETELLDVKPYVKNNRTFVPMRFIAETFGCKVNYKNGTVTVNTKPFVIDGIKVKALQYQSSTPTGSVSSGVNLNFYNETIYNLIIENIGSKIEVPINYKGLSHPSTSEYYNSGIYDFLDLDRNSIKRFDIYTLPQFTEETFPTDPIVLIHDATENQWYSFNETARQALINILEEQRTLY